MQEKRKAWLTNRMSYYTLHWITVWLISNECLCSGIFLGLVVKEEPRRIRESESHVASVVRRVRSIIKIRLHCKVWVINSTGYVSLSTRRPNAYELRSTFLQRKGESIQHQKTPLIHYWPVVFGSWPSSIWSAYASLLEFVNTPQC